MTDQINPTSSEAKRDNLNTPMIALLGFFTFIFLFVLIAGLQVIYYVFQEQKFHAEVVLQKPAELTQIVSKQQEILHGSYRWVNKASGVVAIPIDAAMDLIVQENR
ncbi:MAG: hypothetical protein ACP5I1_12525 [Candidatus Hinthialibacter sp.]